LGAANVKIDELNRNNSYWWTMADGLMHEIRTIHASLSWRVTAPLRLIGKDIIWLVRGGIAWLALAPTSLPVRVAKRLLVAFVDHVSAHPTLKKVALRVLSWTPRLEARLKNIVNPQQADVRLQDVTTNAPQMNVVGPEQLPVRAKQIYRDLKTAVERSGGAR
jgi:hypothetical protein